MFVLDPALLDAADRSAATRCSAPSAASTTRSTGGSTLATGDPVDARSRDWSRTVGADTVYLNADVTPYATARDAAGRSDAARRAPSWRTWGTVDPVRRGRITTAGRHRAPKVFTAFWRRWQRPRPPDRSGGHPRPASSRRPRRSTFGPGIDVDRTRRFDARRAAGRSSSTQRLAPTTPSDRDRPAVDGTSQLSIALKTRHRRDPPPPRAPRPAPAPPVTLDPCGNWPGATGTPISWSSSRGSSITPSDRSTTGSRWRNDPDGLAAWKDGSDRVSRSSTPGCVSSHATGWMHNRVRMITACFLVKDLLVDWRHR